MRQMIGSSPSSGNPCQSSTSMSKVLTRGQRDFNQRDFLVMDLQTPVVEFAGGDANATRDVLVDEQAVAKEDVRS